MIAETSTTAKGGWMDGYVEDPSTGLWLPGRYCDPALCEPETCTECGCTDNTPCAGGCAWIVPGLCSACAPELPPWTVFERCPAVELSDLPSSLFAREYLGEWPEDDRALERDGMPAGARGRRRGAPAGERDGRDDGVVPSKGSASPELAPRLSLSSAYPAAGGSAEGPAEPPVTSGSAA